MPAQMDEQFENALPKPRAAQHRIKGAGDAHARNLHDGFAQWALLLGQLRHDQLRKPWFLADRRHHRTMTREPAEAGRHQCDRDRAAQLTRFDHRAFPLVSISNSIPNCGRGRHLQPVERTCFLACYSRRFSSALRGLAHQGTNDGQALAAKHPDGSLAGARKSSAHRSNSAIAAASRQPATTTITVFEGYLVNVSVTRASTIQEIMLTSKSPY